MKLINKFLLLIVVAFLSVNVCAAAEKREKSLEGNILCVFGDSYVRNHRCPQSETWHAKAAKRLGLQYENCGRNGSSVLYDRTQDGFGPAMTERCKDLPDTIDFLLIIAGHNDADLTKTDEDVAQFSVALSSLIDNLKLRYPSAKIGYVLPWSVDRGNFSKVLTAIKDVCAEKAIPVFNAEEAGGIKVNDIEFRKKYFQGGGERDTAHLNDAGHNLIVDSGVEFIKALAAE